MSGACDGSLGMWECRTVAGNEDSTMSVAMEMELSDKISVLNQSCGEWLDHAVSCSAPVPYIMTHGCPYY